MKARWMAAAGSAAVLATFLSQPSRADVVTDWNAIAASISAAPAVAGDERPAGSVHMALVQVAVYDAVNAIDTSYQPFAVTTRLPTRGASKEAAAAAAAHDMLKAMFPSRTATLDAAYATSLSAIPDSQWKDKGIAVGQDIARRWLVVRANDGRKADVPYTFVSGPGQYEATPGAPPTAPIMPWMAKMTPFVLKRPSQFRTEPPELDSGEYASDVAETHEKGQAVPGDTTSYGAVIAKFHTRNPNLFWGESLNGFVVNQGLSVPENARLLAQLWVTQADATIACWDAKMHYNRWRPYTAIHKADIDGNPDTEVDSSWTAREVTPPHQEYPAAHGCVSGAVTEAIRRYFHTRRMTLTLIGATFPPGTTTTRTYRYLDDVVDEIEDARVYGGMHFRTSVEDGADIGRRVAKLVDKKQFRPARQGGKHGYY